jgi:uncharacterized protein (TIGR03437 family)
MMPYITGLYVVPAIARRSNFRRFAPFALALLITAGAQAANVSSTLTISNGTTTITATAFVIAGNVTLTNLGSGGATVSGTFASSIGTSNVTGLSVTSNFTITLSGGTLTGTYTEPLSILTGASGTASATIAGGTGSYAGYTGSFPSLTVNSSPTSSPVTFSFTATGSGTVNASGGGTTTPVPTITAVQDAGSYTANIAEGGFFTVWGTNLAPSVIGGTNFPRPTSLSGVTVTVTPTAGGTGTPVYLIYIGTGQINCVLPSTVPVGNYNVTVTSGGTTSSPVATQVVARKPALFTQDQSGTGLAVVFNYISQSESDVNRLTTGNYNGSLSSPAKPGQVLIAWGTGLGPYAAGDNATVTHDFSTSETILAIVGGVSIPVAFAGLSGYAADDQINFTLPANVPTGCAVSLQISVAGVLSAPVSISIAPSSGATACVQPGYTTAQLQTLDQGGTINSGGFSLSQATEAVASLGTYTSASVDGSFSQLTGFQLAAAGTANVSVITSGSCSVFHVTTTGTAVVTGHLTEFDAGTVTLNGPGVNNQPLLELSNTYSYSIGTPGTSSSSLQPGTYTLTGAGGNDVGPFSTSITIGSPLTLSSPLPTTVTESAGLTLNWTGGNSTDIVEIIGGSGTVTGTGTSQITNSTEFICSTTAGQKTFTVPASILTQLPTETAAQETAGTATGLLEVGSGPPAVNFNATLKKDGSTIPSTFASSVGTLGLVAYQ